MRVVKRAAIVRPFDPVEAYLDALKKGEQPTAKDIEAMRDSSSAFFAFQSTGFTAEGVAIS